MAKLSPQSMLAAARGMVCDSKHMPYLARVVYAMRARETPGLLGADIGGGDSVVGGGFAVTHDGILIWDPKVAETWSVADMAFAVAHEAVHLLADTRGRRIAKGADPGDFNTAADIAINDLLEAAGLKMSAIKVATPASYGFAPGLTAEQYYDLLRAQKLASAKKILRHLCSGACGSGGGSEAHPGEAEAQAEGGSSGAKPGEGEASGSDGLSPGELEALRRAVASDMKARAEKEAGKGRGSIPGGWVVWADGFLEPPKVRWQSKLARATRGATGMKAGEADHTYALRSILQGSMGDGPGCPILAGTYAPNPEVWLWIDTSGSMDRDEVGECVREARGVIKALGAGIKLGIIDAAVHKVISAEKLSDILAALSGGGGTDFRPAFAHMNGLPTRPALAIFCTDGDGPAPTAGPDYPVIWLLTGGGATPAPWGEAIAIDD